MMSYFVCVTSQNKNDGEKENCVWIYFPTYFYVSTSLFHYAALPFIGLPYSFIIFITHQKFCYLHESKSFELGLMDGKRGEAEIVTHASLLLLCFNLNCVSKCINKMKRESQTKNRNSEQLCKSRITMQSLLWLYWLFTGIWRIIDVKFVCSI